MRYNIKSIKVSGILEENHLTRRIQIAYKVQRETFFQFITRHVLQSVQYMSTHVQSIESQTDTVQHYKSYENMEISI